MPPLVPLPFSLSIYHAFLLLFFSDTYIDRQDFHANADEIFYFLAFLLHHDEALPPCFSPPSLFFLCYGVRRCRRCRPPPRRWILAKRRWCRFSVCCRRHARRYIFAMMITGRGCFWAFLLPPRCHAAAARVFYCHWEERMMISTMRCRRRHYMMMSWWLLFALAFSKRQITREMLLFWDTCRRWCRHWYELFSMSRLLLPLLHAADIAVMRRPPGERDRPPSIYIWYASAATPAFFRR